MFKTEIRSKKVHIEASQQKVWSILFDIDAYPEWNPFTHKIVCDMKPGSAIDLHVRMPKRGDRVQVEQVYVMDAPKQMAWGMSMGASWLLSARRDQWIEATGEQTCSYETADVFEGILAPLVIFLFGEDVEGGFNRMALALKQRAENN